MEINFLDVIFIVIFLYTLLRGVVTGLIRQVVSVLGLVLGIVLARSFYRPLANLVAQVWSPSCLPLLSYALIFTAVLVSCVLLGAGLRRILELSLMSWLDRMAGGGLGLLKGLLFASLLLFFLTVILSPQADFISTSRLAPYVNTGASYVASFVPRELTQIFREKSKRLQEEWKKSVLEKLVHPEKWDEQ